MFIAYIVGEVVTSLSQGLMFNSESMRNMYCVTRYGAGKRNDVTFKFHQELVLVGMDGKAVQFRSFWTKYASMRRTRANEQVLVPIHILPTYLFACVVLLWTSGQPVAETSTWQHTHTHTHTINRHQCPRGIRNRNPSKRAVADSRLRPRGH